MTERTGSPLAAALLALVLASMLLASRTESHECAGGEHWVATPSGRAGACVANEEP